MEHLHLSSVQISTTSSNDTHISHTARKILETVCQVDCKRLWFPASLVSDLTATWAFRWACLSSSHPEKHDRLVYSCCRVCRPQPDVAVALAAVAVAGWQFGIFRSIAVVMLALILTLFKQLASTPEVNSGHRAGGKGFQGHHVTKLVLLFHTRSIVTHI